MPADYFTVHATNPNDGIGGGGCLHSGGQPDRDCEGPWINFFRTSTEFDASPYAVICAKHLRETVEKYPASDVIAGSDVLPIRAQRDVERTDPTVFEGVAGIAIEA